MQSSEFDPESIQNLDLAKRIEETSLNAWPAMQQIFLDGWILRFSKGFTKRSNSIILPYASQSASPYSLHDKIRRCEKAYSHEQLKTIFKITSFNHLALSLDPYLAERGYLLDERSLVLSLAPLSPYPLPKGFTLVPLDQWLVAYCALTGRQEPTKTLHSYILQNIVGECGFALIHLDGELVSCGLAVFEADLVGLFDIYTHPQRRNRGFAREVVEGLLTWAYQRGAKRSYLQVVSDNKAALHMYNQLGFREIYHYWYRIGA